MLHIQGYKHLYTAKMKKLRTKTQLIDLVKILRAQDIDF